VQAGQLPVLRQQMRNHGIANPRAAPVSADDFRPYAKVRLRQLLRLYGHRD
jgi:hypothetical protein